MDIGGRGTQEDSAVAFVSADGRHLLAVVADGLGGHGDGRLASGTVTECAARLWEEHGSTGDDLRRLARSVVENANLAVLDLQARRGTDARSTICCVAASDRQIEIASVGDTRAYLLSDATLDRLTRDHSVTEMLLATGDIAEDAMRGHPDSTRLTQSLGIQEGVRPFVVESLAVRAGQSILLCSDGLWQALPADEIAVALADDSPDRLAALVRNAANAAGETGDNVSAVLLEAFAARPSRLGRLVEWLRH